jgi:hypothetical protein
VTRRVGRETHGSFGHGRYDESMQQALTSSLARAVVIGGVLIAMTLSLSHGRAADPRREVRLVLHAVSVPGDVYLSWWHDGDVRVELEPGELPAMIFTVRAWVDDGCHWKGTETLDPIDPRHYAYRYEETLLHCRPGATPYRKTPRTGIVTVVD